jgi:stage V sporulation protein G
MPSRKMGDGAYRDIAHPITNEFRGTIERTVLREYVKALEEHDLEVDNEIEKSIEAIPA